MKRRKKPNKNFFCTDEAIQYPKVQKFHRLSDTIAVHSRKCIDYSDSKIVSLKATEFSSQFGKNWAAEEKSLAP
jgi:hypothetical protein